MSVRAVAFKSLAFILFALLAQGQSVSAPTVSSATEPKFDYVELVAGNFVIHFFTQRGKSYTLQAASSLPGTNWVNLRFVPPPFRDDHAILTDPITNAHRFYRLAVTNIF